MRDNWTKQDSLITWILEIGLMVITVAVLACGIAMKLSH